MPNYSVQCEGGCEGVHEARLTFEQYDATKKGETGLLCPKCGEAPAKLVFNPGSVNFILREGESGGWASKAIKENKYRSARAKIMEKRERDHVKKNQLVPNYQGTEAHSWSDVQDHVRSTKGAEAASTYNQLVAKEKST